MTAWKTEPRIEFDVTHTTVEQAVCRDKYRCTLAIPIRAALRQAYGDTLIEESVEVARQFGTLKNLAPTIVVTFRTVDPDGKLRNHEDAGGVQPADLAGFVLETTDTTKSMLLRELRGDQRLHLWFDQKSRKVQANRRPRPADAPITPKYAQQLAYEHVRHTRRVTPDQQTARDEKIAAITRVGLLPEYQAARERWETEGPAAPDRRLPRHHPQRTGRFGTVPASPTTPKEVPSESA